jgi:hypothetical protein
LLALCPAATLLFGADSQTHSAPAQAQAQAQATVHANYGKLPMSFEENRGQTAASVKFLSQGQGYDMFLTSSGVTMSLAPPAALSHPDHHAVVRMNFAGAHTPAISGEARQAATSSYFLGNDPSKWVTGAPTYARVHYGGLYPGVDLLFYGNQRQLEYDFVLAPGADPKAIRLQFDGVDGLRLDSAGNLVLQTATGEILQHKPLAYQQFAGARRLVDGRYVIQSGHRVAFEIARYDKHQPLVIDPVLTFATYLGSETLVDGLTGTYPAVAVDSQGNAYMTGFNGGSTFPGNPTVLGPGGTDVFVAKLNPSGTALLYSVVLGGGFMDVGGGIAVDGAGHAYITGFTSSPNFPVSAGASQPGINGATNAFVLELNPAGSALIYSTFLGGSGNDYGRAISVNESGSAYVTGTATSTTNFPLVHWLPGGSVPGPGFLTEVNSTGTEFVYSTYLSYGIGYGIAVDSAGDAYVAGTTGSEQTPIPAQAYVAKVTQSAGVPSISYGPVNFGSSGATLQTVAYGIAIDSMGNAYVTGSTNDPAFPVTAGAPQAAYAGGLSDAFALKLDAAGDSTPVYATYIGGIGTNPFPERGSGIGVDSNGYAYVAGTTQCIGFPISNPIAGAQNGGPSALLETTNTAASWAPVNLTGTSPNLFDQVTALAFNTATTIYAGTSAFNATGGGVYQSTDGGSTWSLANTGITSTTIDAIAVDPSTPATVYAIGSGTIYQSTTSGASWTALGQTAGTSGTLAVAKNPPATIYVGSSTGLLYSTNSGASFTAALNVPVTPVTSILVDPTNAFTAYAGTGMGVYRTTNGGVGSWGAVNSGLPAGTVTSLAINNSSTLYATVTASNPNDSGLYAFTNGGSSWSLVQTNPDVAVTFDLVAVDAAGNVYLAGQGGGLEIGTNSSGSITWSTLTYNGLTRNNITALAAPPGATGTVFAGIVSVTDAFLTQISPDGSTFVSSTCIGGSDNSLGQNIAVTPSGTVYISGATVATNFPVTPGVVQTAQTGNFDPFLVRVDNVPLIQVNATLNGSPFLGALGFMLTGASSQSGTAVPMTYSEVPAGSYTLMYVSGGPPGATLSSITPSATQTLSAGGVITFTLNFTSSSSTTGTIQVNATLNLSPYTGSLNFQLTGPTGQTGSSAPATYSTETAGSYTLSYTSGGPMGASFVSITPSTTQTLSGGQTITYTINFAQVNSTPLQFVPVTPCRLVDTRNPDGPLGGPALDGNSRSFPIPTSSCGIPSSAMAYSLNVTVVPSGDLGYLTIWPTGQPQPVVSTLNSQHGINKADAAIVLAGTSGAVSVYASAATNVVLDINGYFTPASPSTLAFYPVTPCRLVDTRNADGPLGGPIMAAQQTRTFPLPTSSCNSIPAGALAYSLNFTVVPSGVPLGYLTTWPTGESQPVVSTLNAPTGLTTANAAIVPAGTSGSINVFTSDTTQVVIDINGYFAPVATGGLSFYGVVPCRVVNTENAVGPLGGPELFGERDFPLSTSNCGLPSNAGAYSLNATVVPQATLGYLTLWPTGETQPVVSTLNSPDGSTDSNAAIVPVGTSGSISAYASAGTQLILDTNGYFAVAP